MSGFSADWLSLREPLDARSRNSAIAAELAATLRAGRAENGTVRIMDLGAGTGAHLRYLAPLLGGAQEWVLVEQDRLLLEAMKERMQRWAVSQGGTVAGSAEWLAIAAPDFECRIETRMMDLARELDQLVIHAAGLVCASALLDLVSRNWLATLARTCAAASTPVWFTLTYDGRIQCEPTEPEDSEVRDLVNAHQLSDKGFGPALGTAAAGIAEQVFAELGYRVRAEASDWNIRASEQALQYALCEGWFEAASEISPARSSQWQNWLERRRAHIAGARSELSVGHRDMLGLPASADG